MRRIEIDEDVWRMLQQAAQPLVDSPNTVLRRIFGLDNPINKRGDRTMTTVVAGICGREAKEHSLASARHCMAHQEIWWYGIPPLGKKYQPNDRVTFKLENFHGKTAGELSIELSGHFLDRIDRAVKDKKGYTHVKIVREIGDSETTIYFGRKDNGDAPERVTVDKV